MWILSGFFNFVLGNNPIIVIARKFKWRQIEGKVWKARNI